MTRKSHTAVAISAEAAPDVPELDDRGFRRGLWLVLIPAVLVVAALGARALIGGDRLAEWLIEKATGYQVSVEGDAAVGFLPNVRVTAENITLVRQQRSLSAETPLPLARIARIEMTINPIRLTDGAVEILSLTLVRPQIRLDRGKDGDRNWLDPAAANKRDHSEFHWPLAVRAMTITGGAIRYTDDRLSHDVLIDNVELETVLDHAETAARARLTAEGRWGNEPIYLEVERRRDLLAKEDGRDSARLSFQSGPLFVEMNGTMSRFGALDVKAETNVDLSDLSALSRLLPFMAGDRIAPISLAGGMAYRSGVFHFDELDIDVGGETVKGRATLSFAGRVPVVSAEFSIEKLDVGGLSAAAAPFSRSGQLAWPLAGEATLQWTRSGFRGLRGAAGAASVSWSEGAPNLGFVLKDVRLEDGVVEGNGEIKTAEQKRALRLNLDFAGLNAERLAAVLFEKQGVSGRISGALDILTVGAGFEEWRAAALGSASLIWQNGRLTGGEIARILGDGRADVALDRMTAAFNLQHGKAMSGDAVLVADGGSMYGTLDLDMVSGALSVELGEVGAKAKAGVSYAGPADKALFAP